MKLTQRLLLSVLAAAIALPVIAFAAKADRKKKNEPAVAFATVDKNSDSSISREEFVAAMKDKQSEEAAKSQFATLDKNSDSKLSKDEYAAIGGETKKKRKKDK
jgi:Ca2+-binding EF-hand superfamily protein